MTICPKHGVAKSKWGKCRVCDNEYRKQRRALGLIKPQPPEKQSSAKAWNEAIDHFGPDCACCGQINKRVLQLHHPEGDGGRKRRELVKNPGSYLKRLKALGWPEDHKLEVLCANCHYEITRYGEVTWFKDPA